VLEALKIILVLALCVPIFFVGGKLVSSLLDTALAGKKKVGKSKRKNERG